MTTSNQSGSSRPLVFVLGSTCTGKSNLSLQLAEQYAGHIVNADSVQVYEAVDIGTAKPSSEELARVPHHLYSFISKGVEFTAGQYQKVARDLVANHSIQGPMFVTGGSGFYVQALEWGMFDSPVVDPVIQKKWEQLKHQEGLESLYLQLQKRDPECAQKIYPQDAYRIMRALGVMDSTGKTMSEIQRQFQNDRDSQRLKNRIFKIGLFVERDVLRKRVTQRVQAMLERGLVDEVAGLVAEGLEQWAPLKSIGYKEVIPYVNGLVSKQEMIEQLIKNTMGLAKRQTTWFKKDEHIHWIDATDSKSVQGNDILAKVESFL